MSYLDKLMAQGERPLFETRIHWSDFAAKLILLAFVLLVGVALAVGAWALLPQYVTNDDTAKLVLTALIVLVLVIYPLIQLVIGYVRWRAQQVVVTNLRVIHLSGVFSKNVLDSSLEKVNDVLMHQSFLGRMLVSAM